MPTIYEYLNSISDLLVPMQQQYGTIDLWLDLNHGESTRYTCVIKTETGNVFGFGIGPAAAYDDALAKMESGRAEREIRAKYEQKMQEEIAALHRYDESDIYYE